VNYLPKSIGFDVVVNGESVVGCSSVVGSGAGRPSGGPVFNLILDSAFKEFGIVDGLMTAYADDSMVKIELCDESVLFYLQAFEHASNFGLQMHKDGPKGPTILVSKKSTKFKPPNSVTCVRSVKYLGLDLSFDKNFQLYASLPSKTFRNMMFLVHQLGTGLRLAYFGSSNHDSFNVFMSVSRSISSLIESRIQYFICFSGHKTLYRLYLINRLCVCFLIQMRPSFFGFRTSHDKLLQNDNKSPLDLYDFISKIQS